MNSCGSRWRISRSAGKRHGARLVHGLADFLAANLARTRAEADAAVAVHAANVRSRNADQRMLDRNAGDVFRVLHRFLNAADGLVEFGDHAFAQAARFADAVAAITQSVLAQLGHQHAVLALPTSMAVMKLGS